MQVDLSLAKDDKIEALKPSIAPKIDYDAAEAFGGRHHTTIMHACDEIESLRLNDHNIGQDLGFLTQVLKG